MGDLQQTVNVLNSLSPLAIIGLLAYIIFLMVSKNGPVKKITDNYDIPSLAASLLRMENTLTEIRDGIHFLQGRLNRRY